MHGVKIFGDSTQAAAGKPRRQEAQRDAAHDAGGQEPMDAVDPSAVTAKSKKKERDDRRAAANRSRRSIARWLMFVKRLKYHHIWSPMWTELLRSQMSPKRDARRKIRAAFWKEWTRPQFDGGGTSMAPFGEQSALGLQSLRDRYILRRARALMARAYPEPCPESPFGPEDFQSEDQMLQAAIEASLMDTPAETRGGDRTAATRNLDEAGLKTPGSARRGGKKKCGGRDP